MAKVKRIKTDFETHSEPKSFVGDSNHLDSGQQYKLARKMVFLSSAATDVEAGATTLPANPHRDLFNSITSRLKLVLRYSNSVDTGPKPLVVQATPQVLCHPSGGWERIKVRGNAPILLRLSWWVLQEILDKTEDEVYTARIIALVALKALLVSPIQLILLSLPISSAGAKYWYDTVPTQSYLYPIHVRNQLDARPFASMPVTGREHHFDFASQRSCQLKPRRLVVLRNKRWLIIEDVDLPYVYVSYSRAQFDPDDLNSRKVLYKVAERITRAANLQAYWLDHLCITQLQGTARSDDINRIFDVIRGARQVSIAVPDLDPMTMVEWGKCIWALSEVLLSPTKNIEICSADKAHVTKSRTALADCVWKNDLAGYLLAEYFSGTLTLNRLELIGLEIQALSARQHKALYSQGDFTHVLMGLMGHRSLIDQDDNQFQALARLSLVSGSDKIVERMICMLPDSGDDDYKSNKKFVVKDKLGADFWDIEPLCQVVGVCEESTVILDGCRGASIQWNEIPNVMYLKRRSHVRTALTFVLRSGGALLLIGVALTARGQVDAGAVFLIVGFMMLISSPWSTRLLYGGNVWAAAPWLIGFEGVMPIQEIESMMFSNINGRLSYAPGSSLLACKHDCERTGKEPDWVVANGVSPPIPSGQRLFTLVDTGTLTVTLFTAEKPPLIALIAGREGGTLRVLLCHYERSTNTLYKETVLRMETPMMDKTGLLGWIKIA